MKKFIVLLAAVALVAASCNNNSGDNQTNNNSAGNQVPTPNQTYKNATYGFQFDYTNDFQFVTPNYANLEDKVVQIQLPQSAFPKTNFGDAAFAVSAQFAKSLSACLALTPPEGGDGFKTKVRINGVDFYMTQSHGAGAGNRYDAKVFRTVKSTGGSCIELVEMIHTGAIGNYPAGTVTEVDPNQVYSKLDLILNNFKFTN